MASAGRASGLTMCGLLVDNGVDWCWCPEPRLPSTGLCRRCLLRVGSLAVAAGMDREISRRARAAALSDIQRLGEEIQREVAVNRYMRANLASAEVRSSEP